MSFEPVAANQLALEAITGMDGEDCFVHHDEHVRTRIFEEEVGGAHCRPQV